MAHVIVHQTTEDFAKWKPFFDGDSNNRKAHGSKGGQLFRSAHNPNEVVIVFDWDSVKNAMKFVESPELRETMQKAGAGKPDVYFFEEGEHFSF